MGKMWQNWNTFICSHKDFALCPSLRGHFCPPLWGHAPKWHRFRVKGGMGKIQLPHMLMTLMSNTGLVIQEMFCGCSTPKDSPQMTVVLMRFLRLIKFMENYESGSRHLPEKKKRKLKLAQQLEVGWWQELLSNQLFSTACSASLLPHTLIKIFWSTFFATEGTATGNSKCLKPQHP